MGMDEWDHSGERVERGGKSQDCRHPNKGDREGVASEVKNILKAVWNCRRSAWSRGSEWPAVMDEVQWSHPVVSDSGTPWAVVYQASPSMEFSRQEYWSGLPSPSPGALPDPGIKRRSPALQANALPFEPSGKPRSEWEVDWNESGHVSTGFHNFIPERAESEWERFYLVEA